jgi:hypothetical protein
VALPLGGGSGNLGRTTQGAIRSVDNALWDVADPARAGGNEVSGLTPDAQVTTAHADPAQEVRTWQGTND